MYYIYQSKATSIARSWALSPQLFRRSLWGVPKMGYPQNHSFQYSNGRFSRMITEGIPYDFGNLHIIYSIIKYYNYYLYIYTHTNQLNQDVASD